jgi:RHS repeat-associated protein
VTDRGGRTTFFIHDALRRLIQAVNPEGGITQFGYDANGNRTSLADPNGNVTTFNHDANDRLVRKTYADGTGLSFRYDADGLLSSRTNARGIVTTYTHDANHNLATVSYSDGTPGVTNTFDAFDRLATVRDGAGTNFYGYDVNSQLISHDGPWAYDTIVYSYDCVGRRTNILVQGGQPTSYIYDSLHRLTGASVGTRLYAYAYAGANPLVQRLNRPNGAYTVYGYDSLNRLTSLSNRRSDGQVINESLYAYNAQDLRVSETVSNGAILVFTNQHLTYDYTPLNQLLTSTPPAQLFAHDADGNMTRGYTPEGHPFSAAYDAENRLTVIMVTNSGSLSARLEYLYAWTGRRAQEIRLRPGQGTNRCRQVRADSLLVQERDDTDNITRDWAWGLNPGGGVGGLLRLRQGGQDYQYVYDGRANVTALLDDAQKPVATYGYDPFGVILLANGSLDQPFRFSTKPYEPLSGLTCYGLRYYTPALGRWTSRDPLGEVMGGLNLYEFVGNNPVSNADPDGRILMQIGGLVVGGGINAWRNYEAFKAGCISKSDYINSIIFGAGAGLVGSMIPGLGGVLTGGVLAGFNDANNQAINRRNRAVNVGRSLRAAGLGAVAGAIGNAGQAAGRNLISIPDQIGKVVGSQASQVQDLSDLGGLIGEAIGAGVTEPFSE